VATTNYVNSLASSFKRFYDAGSIVQHYAYSAFGKILKIVDNSGNDITVNPLVKTSYGFTNREYDSETGMMYYRARYYMPEIGRFISEDPHQGNVMYPLTFTTKYSYAGNNPILNIDPKGEFFVTAMIIGSLIGAYMAHTSGGNVLEGALIGAVAGAVGAYAGGIGAYIGGQSGIVGMQTLVGVALGSISGAVVGGIVGGNLSAMRGAGYNEGSVFGSNVGGLVGGLTGGLNGYFGGELDKVTFRFTSEYILKEYNLLVNSPGKFITAHPGIVAGAGLLIASELNCKDNEEYRIGEGCVSRN